MSLVQIGRYVDVYEADLAAAFLESCGIRVTVTERFQTTLDPLMQRVLGIRLMVRASDVEAARDLLARANAGEFADAGEDDLPSVTSGVRAIATLMALAAFTTGGFWGNSLPRRFRPFAWQGMLISMVGLMLALMVIWLAADLILDPP
jgi:hypothetical protein